MTARLAYTIGMDGIADTVKRMGVYDKFEPYLSNSLGSEVTTLLKMTTGYAEFVNGGRKLVPTLVDRVQDRYGKTAYRFDQRDCSECNQAEWTGQEEPLLEENQAQVLDPHTAYQVVSILEGVVQRGTGVTIRQLNRPLAGKTGTTSDFRDAWFIGFSPDLAVGVYIGKDDFSTLGRGEQGALAAAPIFREFMREALADTPPTPFRKPQGIVLSPVDAKSGTPVAAGAPGSIMEAFKPGTEPGASLAGLLDIGANEPALVSEGMPTARPAALEGAAPARASVRGGTGGLY
jgi:penicillin-binding protein 1A